MKLNCETVMDIYGSNDIITNSSLKSQSKKNIPYLSPIKVVYSHLKPLALQYEKYVTSAPKDKSDMTMVKLVSSLDLAVMVCINSSKNRDLIILLIDKGVLMLHAALILGIPSYFF